MRLLLDTHIWAWALLEPERLSKKVVASLSDPASELWLSPISVWELVLLIERGRLDVDRPAAEWVRLALDSVPLRAAELNFEVALRSRLLDLQHDDPADRFLAATAAVYDLTLVTADARLASGEGYGVLANR